MRLRSTYWAKEKHSTRKTIDRVIWSTKEKKLEYATRASSFLKTEPFTAIDYLLRVGQTKFVKMQGTARENEWYEEDTESNNYKQ